mgnify:FL=1|jgi:hypothetical protein
MYRFLTFILLSLTIFGCSKANNDVSNPSAVTIEKSFIGSVEVNNDYISGLDSTHILLTDANSKIYLKSFLHNLNEYINARVRVSGSFSELNFTNKSVSELEVSSIDLLEKVIIESNKQTFSSQTFEKIGLSFNLPEDLQIKENDQSVFFSFGNSNFTITPSVLQSDYKSYLKIYSEYASDILRVDNYTFDLFLLSDYEHLYTLDMGTYVLEIKVSLFDNSLQSQIDLLLENFVVQVLPTSIYSIQAPEQEASITPDVDMPSEQEDPNNSTDDTQIQTNVVTPEEDTEYASSLKIDSTPVSTSTVELHQTLVPETMSPYDSEIKRFEISSKALLGDLLEVSRYYFAESNHFYVEYKDNNGDNKRALISYSNNLNVVARFVEDEVMDWRLVSGQNLVYDQKLTLVDSAGKSHNLKEGFRLFESLPLKFSLQYPMQMYYMRNDDTYIFANDPNLKDVSFRITKVSGFDKEKYNNIKHNMFFNGVDYLIELDGAALKLTNESLPNDVLNYILSTVSILSL